MMVVKTLFSGSMFAVFYIGKPLDRLKKVLKQDWPYIEDVLFALLEQLIPALLLT